MADRITDPKGGRLPHRADGVWPAHLQQLKDRVSEDDVIRGCRSSLAQEGLFMAVQEAFLTETASGPTWFCRPPCGPIGRGPAPTPTGPAILKGAHVQPSHEEPNQECPLLFTTGRIVNHFYSRATTGRARQKTGAAPESGWSCRRPTRLAGGGRGEPGPSHLPQRPSGRHGVNHRHPPRGVRPVPLRLSGPAGGRRPRRAARAANQFTITASDPVSKQPL